MSEKMPTFEELLNETPSPTSPSWQSDDKQKNDSWATEKRKNAPNTSNIFLLRHHNDIHDKDLQVAIDSQTPYTPTANRLRLRFVRDNLELSIGLGFVIAIFMGFLGYSAMHKALVTLAPHTTLTTQVVSAYTTRCGKNGSSTCYHLTVNFVANDHAYTLDGTTDSRTYALAQVENRIPVTYYQGNPTIFEMGQPIWSIMDTAVCLGMVIVIVTGLKSAVFYYRKNRALQDHGQLIIGQITDVTRQRVKHGTNLKIKYLFTSPEGQQLVGNQSNLRNDYKKQRLPLNAQVAVLYIDNDNYKIL